jgi:hypothetical protein
VGFALYNNVSNETYKRIQLSTYQRVTERVWRALGIWHEPCNQQ